MPLPIPSARRLLPHARTAARGDTSMTSVERARGPPHPGRPRPASAGRRRGNSHTGAYWVRSRATFPPRTPARFFASARRRFRNGGHDAPPGVGRCSVPTTRFTIVSAQADEDMGFCAKGRGRAVRQPAPKRLHFDGGRLRTTPTAAQCSRHGVRASASRTSRRAGAATPKRRGGAQVGRERARRGCNAVYTGPQASTLIMERRC